jgi:hypothetical protein
LSPFLDRKHLAGKRRIAGRVNGDTIEIDGETWAITSGNAPKIRAAAKTLRAQMSQTHAANHARLS